MELGGHAPVVVCPDADLDTVAAGAAKAAYRNAAAVRHTGQHDSRANRLVADAPPIAFCTAW